MIEAATFWSESTFVVTTVGSIFFVVQKRRDSVNSANFLALFLRAHVWSSTSLSTGSKQDIVLPRDFGLGLSVTIMGLQSIFEFNIIAQNLI